MRVGIQNLTTSRVDSTFVRQIIGAVLRHEGIDDTIYIEVVFVGPGRMRKLNKKYNKSNRVTDILSFEGGDGNFISPHPDAKNLGELIICLSEVSKQAGLNNRDFDWEFAHVLTHGTLHLLGHEHESSEGAWERMHNLEEEIIDKALGHKPMNTEEESSSAKLTT